VNKDDEKRMHALSVAALGRAWSETDMIIGQDVFCDGLVAFDQRGIPRLTEDGYAAFAAAISGMKGVGTT
jgi:hypothetical protein